MIGINTAIADPGSAQNVGFAIPISNAKVIIERLREGKQPAFLGVKTVNVDQAKLDGESVEVDEGAYVQEVTPAARRRRPASRPATSWSRSTASRSPVRRRSVA